MKKIKVGLIVTLAMIIGVSTLAFAEQKQWKNGDIWEHYIDDCYVHSNLYCAETVHSTSTGYSTKDGSNYVCARSGLTEPGKIAKSKSGTHTWYTDRAWYKRNNK